MSSANQQDNAESELALQSVSTDKCVAMLSPAPLSMCLLGQLVVVTLDNDAPLVEKEEDYSKFPLVKYPRSLRTTMFQIVNQGWEAFNSAHVNMISIQLSCTRMPTYVKNIMKLLHEMKPGKESLYEKNIRKLKEKLEQMAGECTVKAKTIETDFESVLKLIDQVTEATSSAVENQERKMKDIELKEQQISSLKDDQSSSQSISEKSEEKLVTAREEKYAAIRSRPEVRSWWKMFLQPRHEKKYEEAKAREFEADKDIEKLEAEIKEQKKKTEQCREQITQLMTELAEMDLCKVDFNKLRDTLKRGCAAVGELKSQWGQLATFFATFQRTLQGSFATTIKDFLDLQETNTLEDLNDEVLVEIMTDYATESNLYALSAASMSSIYVQVSNNHIMKQLNEMGKLVSLDSTTEEGRQEIKSVQQAMLADAQGASKAIEDIIDKTQQQFIEHRERDRIWRLNR